MSKDSTTTASMTLADVAPMKKARIRALQDDFAPYERQRLIDLGAVPGTEVQVRGAAAFGGLRAYGLRGAIIGLRQQQAQRILVEEVA
ncbi:MAG: hypothetical protein E1N59_3020 [Puniceicoccaceae bacterium 5H]|nr:MAG: hypothetical protein E1N59_3020 [Puniceicoccaceae bacterium 5H]